MFPPALDSTQGGILLALRANGAPDLLTAADIAAVPCSAVIVTLSGCSSAGRQMLPGSGLAGLTRAWIAAGARTVVASLWPTTDSDGVLFRYFYERLRGGDAPAEALRQAQLENLRSGRLRSREWAAYVVVGD
jgi:CHAT domain-containing protein